MKLSVDHLLDLLDEVKQNTEFDYIKPGNSKVKLLSVNRNVKTVSLQRVTGNDFENANMSKDTLAILADSISENVPFSIESVLKGSGNKRSVYEAILARTSEFYKCMVGRIKHLVWIPSQKHQVDELVEISLDDIRKMTNFELINSSLIVVDRYRPYIIAIKSKPFLLLAGISGTGKSRIVRELARACWEEGSEEYKAQKPKNFEMIQVKPNWHDSSELIGYVSRVSGKAEFVAGDFLKFIAKAWENEDVPHFLCLDEMNLAPVEQYFAEYLSVIESRKNKNGRVVTDAIIEKCAEQWYFDLTSQLTEDDDLRKKFNEEGISIPKNLIVVGTVNMDETTFSFSRKVLDRAMTIEMNEVDLEAGLDNKYERIGKLGVAELIGNAVEGVDVYADNQEVCKTVIGYLKAVNDKLEGTPFKVAYRTRNEFLLYVVNNLPYSKNEDGEELSQEVIIARALDEITNMKILSRIEGDTEKIGNILEDLSGTIKEQLSIISSGKEYSGTKGREGTEYSVSLAKLKEMKIRLKSGYTSFWS